MKTSTYQTTAEMALANPKLRVDAIRYRLARLLEGEEAARTQAGPAKCALIDQWHALEASEAKLQDRANRREDRRPSVHRQAWRSARRRAAAACPVPIYTLR